MILQIPVTATNTVEWVRRCANAVNELIRRVTALEKATALPFTVGSITLTPGPLPSTPIIGMIVVDEADNKPKAWDGTAWNSFY